MNLQGGLILLQEVLDDLPASEGKVARFILDDPKRFISLSITELAEESGTSAAGVVRLCKRLRMNGFRELKLRITMDVSQAMENQRTLRIEPGVPLEEIARSLVHNDGVILQDILKTLDIDAAKRAVDAMCRARKVDVYGTGASGVVAHEMTQKLLRIGIGASYHQDADLQIVSACGLAPGDAAIAFSYSGENRMVNSAISEAKASGATTICVTRFSHNTLADMCDVNLFVPSTEPIIRDGMISSRIAQLVVVDIVFSGIVACNGDGLKGKLTRTAEALHGHA